MYSGLISRGGGTLPCDLSQDTCNVPTPSPLTGPWTDRRLWKHYLPATSFVGSFKGDPSCSVWTRFVAGIFPEPDKDPVIQIANMVIRQGEKDPFIRNVFTLKKCARIVGAEVLSFDKETELLKVKNNTHWWFIYTARDRHRDWYR